MTQQAILHQDAYVCHDVRVKIQSITPRMILDSRGNPTVEVDLVLTSGAFGRAAVPSGASTGDREAVELRDGHTDYLGLGVEKVLTHIATVITPTLLSDEISSQKELDSKLIQLDGSENKSTLGANAILVVSLAFAKACASEQHIPLFTYIAHIAGNRHGLHTPIPMFNVINGGKHANKSADMQEFMIVPHGLRSFSKQLQAGSEIFHNLKSYLESEGYATSVGDEGGFTLPSGKHNEDALTILVKAIKNSGYQPGGSVAIALDVAASELYDGKKYLFEADEKRFTAQELTEYYKNLLTRYPIISIEDGLDQNDWPGWQHMDTLLDKDVLLVGDDLLVTNVKYIQKAIDEKACNAVLIKPNQIGTLTETIEAVQLAHKHKLTTIMSHRSGETEDTTIADLAVGLGCKYIKSGSLSRSERLAKYNQLLRISEQL